MGCGFEGCPIKKGNFNYPNEKRGKFCSKHKLEGMVDLTRKKCQYIDDKGKRCTTQPSFGFSDKKPPVRCKNHSVLGMIDKVTKKCDFVEENGSKCIIAASFNFPNKNVGKRCKKHIEKGMICVRTKKCEFIENDEQCEICPCFNFKGEIRGRRCKKHKLEGMVDVTKNKCEIKDCDVTACFNFKGESGGIRCKKHILPGMKDVRIKKCKFAGCDISPNFNFVGMSAAFCKKHALDNMVDVSHVKCNFENCPTRPTFGFLEESPTRCMKHIMEGMISTDHRKCENENCDIRPNYNYSGSKDGRFCKLHKLDNMINICSKKCDQCKNVVNYGKLFSEKVHCSKHKLANEFKRNKPICEEDECEEKAFYTNDGTNYPRRCEEHKLNDDINIVERPCSNCGLSYFLNDKTGLCNDCNDFIIKKVHKIKETIVLEYIKSKGIIFESEDRIPENGCAKYRPDGVIDFLYFKVILEIDENQHKSYADKCEMTRMIQLHQDFGGLPIIFIRYNPDNYKDANRKIIKPNSRRLCELYDVLRSLEILKNDYEKNNTKLPSLSAIYMFYDDYSGVPKLEAIDILKKVREL